MVCDIFFLYATPTQLGNSSSLKRCLMFGNYLWVPVLGKSQDHETRGKRTDIKNHQDHGWCYVIFVQMLRRNLFGTGWWVSCQKEASAAPQQGHSFEGKVLIYCSSHLPPWLHTLLQCTAWATRCGKPSMVRRYARRRVCDCEVMEVTLRPASLTPKGLRGYISCACVQCVQGSLSRSVSLETIFLKACVCFLALLWHITTAWMV